MKNFRKLAGVTLLEIMLVLAIAALIIVMSVRYFQSASISQQATAFLSQLQAIAAAENSVSQGTGNFVNSSSLSGIIPTGGLAAPWGNDTLVVAKGSAAGSFTVTTKTMPVGVCTLIRGQLLTTSGGGNWSISTDTSCATITYNINP